MRMTKHTTQLVPTLSIPSLLCFYRTQCACIIYRDLYPMNMCPYYYANFTMSVPTTTQPVLNFCRPGIPFWSKVIDVATHTSGRYILTPMMHNLPGTTPASLMVGFELVKLQYGTFQKDEVVRTPWAVHYRDAIDIMRVYDVEFAFPVDIKHPLVVVKAVRKVIDIVEDYAFNGMYIFAQECSQAESELQADTHNCVHFCKKKNSNSYPTLYQNIYQ